MKRTSKPAKKPYRPYEARLDRRTGAKIWIERTVDSYGAKAVDSLPDEGPMPWSVSCTTHREHTLCSTLKEAREWARDPGIFCSKCSTRARRR